MAVNFQVYPTYFLGFNLVRENEDQNYPEDYQLARNALDLFENEETTNEQYYDSIRYFINPTLTDEELSNMPAAELQQLLGNLRQEVQTILADA